MIDHALCFRPATEADAEALGRLNHQLIRDEGHRNPMSVDELVERMRRWLADDGYEALLGFDGDELVAYVLWRDEPDCVYLRQIFVHRDQRRQGVARHLMLSVFERWPGKRLVVDVLAGNARALAFWRRMGYRDYAVMLERLPPGDDEA
ncbi:GNAT family N-acetyltransferase [Piscinibacter sp. HJYY11]|uniref:GNAT family N-acetyltransferase n=1 Tax=Piscinibacter sp. HJYY11 TaxID=2801333 RepID=UPI00191FC88B|nr:GNAT family N-acetyltransferase [Piscinibacter sp. HJYY11]MBL0728704.1 GNAT family N-acetyltransferase [Piscinibacter sp. HJYY11]